MKNRFLVFLISFSFIFFSFGQESKEPAWLSKLDPAVRKQLLGEFQESLKSNVRIAFFGMVIDQDGKPVSDAKISMEVYSFNEQLLSGAEEPKIGEEQKTTKVESVTDNQGFFMIANIKGSFSQLKLLKKEGYRSPFDGTSAGSWALNQMDPWEFHYYTADPLHSTFKIYIPDPKNPVVFHMLRLKHPEPLIQSGRDYELGTESKIYTIDLLKPSKAVEGGNTAGDIRVQVKRAAHSDGQKGDWSFVMDAVDGGIIESGDPSMYLAPESGYKPRYELVMKAVDPNWSDQVEKKFYVSSRGGKVYTAIQITILANLRGKSAIETTYLANPSGSRNLEFDPLKAIDPERIAKVGLEKAIEEVKAKSSK